MPAPGSSEKSDKRRRAVLDAAVTCFARKGFDGTTTTEIADRAGISQPYLYRLFANKQTLFAHAVFHVSELMASTLAAHIAAAGPSPEATLRTARSAYGSLIENRDVLRFLMHANCATDEPLVGDAVRWCYAKQVELVSELLGSDEAVRQWFGAGMLENVATVLGLAGVDEPWARILSGD
jgi:AcrR family transcriptional regulator